jgi:hypothetical protein
MRLQADWDLHERTDGHCQPAPDDDEQLQHALMVLGVGEKLNGDEFWRGSPQDRQCFHVDMSGRRTSRVRSCQPILSAGRPDFLKGSGGLAL